jgi:GNAT superfamily N-acetyltransferase
VSQLPAPHDVPRLATSDDAAAVTDVLVDAFADDLMWGSSWAFPDPRTRSENRRAVFRILVEGALRHRWTWMTSGATAASLWIPPEGSELSARQEAALSTLLDESIPGSLDRVLAGFALIEAARPREEHYYLTLLGSDPAIAGQGIGSELLRHTLTLIDAVGAPAYLETSDDLVPFYRRFDFDVSDRFALPDGPSVNTMWRPAVGDRTTFRNPYDHGRSPSGL